MRNWGTRSLSNWLFGTQLENDVMLYQCSLSNVLYLISNVLQIFSSSWGVYLLSPLPVTLCLMIENHKMQKKEKWVCSVLSLWTKSSRAEVGNWGLGIGVGGLYFNKSKEQRKHSIPQQNISGLWWVIHTAELNPALNCSPISAWDAGGQPSVSSPGPTPRSAGGSQPLQDLAF